MLKRVDIHAPIFGPTAEPAYAEPPDELIEALESFGDTENVLVVGGMFEAPYEPESYTDTLGWHDPPPAVTESVAMLFAILSVNLVSYDAYGGGASFQRVGIVGRSQMLAELAGRQLRPHTDLPHLRLRGEPGPDVQRKPDVTVLACIKGDPETFTYSCDFDAALDSLSQRDQSLLRDTAYEAVSPSAWSRHVTVGSLACVRDTEHGVVGRLSPNLVDSDSAPHRAAVDHLLEATRSLAKSTALLDGEILLMANQRQAHGRMSTTGEMSRERTLLRAYGCWD